MSAIDLNLPGVWIFPGGGVIRIPLTPYSTHVVIVTMNTLYTVLINILYSYYSIFIILLVGKIPPHRAETDSDGTYAGSWEICPIQPMLVERRQYQSSVVSYIALVIIRHVASGGDGEGAGDGPPPHFFRNRNVLLVNIKYCREKKWILNKLRIQRILMIGQVKCLLVKIRGSFAPTHPRLIKTSKQCQFLELQCLFNFKNKYVLHIFVVV